MRTLLESQVSSAAEHATGVRRELHQIPELLFTEHKTASVIRRELERLQIPFTAGVEGAPTATIALIGERDRPCIALRADIDALPIEEQTGVSYTSTHPGRMHACGHDGHAACLLGTAAVLRQLDLPVCVKLLFQPAEEAGGGAQRLVDAGVLDGRLGPKVQAIFGIHGWPGLPLGKIATKPGALLAAVDNFSAIFRGHGAHGAYPHLGRDPIVAAAEGICSLQQIASRETDPVEPAIVTIGRISGGSAQNIIPESVLLEGTARSLSPETRSIVRAAIPRRLEGVAAANGMQVDFQWNDCYPATTNDPAMADYVAATVRSRLSPDAFLPVGSASMGGEDFACYLQNVPGCFILVGLCPPDETSVPGLHHPKFNFNDQAIPLAIRLFTQLVLNAPSALRG